MANNAQHRTYLPINKVTLLITSFFLSTNLVAQQKRHVAEVVVGGVVLITLGSLIGYKLYKMREEAWSKNRERDIAAERTILKKLRQDVFAINSIAEQREDFLKLFREFQRENSYMKSIEKLHPRYFNWNDIHEHRTVIKNMFKLIWLIDKFEHEESFEKILAYFPLEDYQQGNEISTAIKLIDRWVEAIYYVPWFSLPEKELAIFKNYYEKAHIIRERLRAHQQLQEEINRTKSIFSE